MCLNQRYCAYIKPLVVYSIVFTFFYLTVIWKNAFKISPWVSKRVDRSQVLISMWWNLWAVTVRTFTVFQWAGECLEDFATPRLSPASSLHPTAKGLATDSWPCTIWLPLLLWPPPSGLLPSWWLLGHLSPLQPCSCLRASALTSLSAWPAPPLDFHLSLPFTSFKSLAKCHLLKEIDPGPTTRWKIAQLHSSPLANTPCPSHQLYFSPKYLPHSNRLTSF